MRNPDSLNVLGYAMGKVYAATTDQILINLARHFKYLKPGEEPGGAFMYQAKKLAEMGQVTQETIKIIKAMLGDADKALKDCLEKAILDALDTVEPKLRDAAEKGLLPNAQTPELSPNMTNAFVEYYRQSADKLNLVNTVMLRSTQRAYEGMVSDITSRMLRAQNTLNTATGQIVTGAESFNQALKQATANMMVNGITGFVDHGGHRWTPETYVAMDMRTTFHNTARQAFFDRNAEYGNDLYVVSWHPGARPLCYPWQGKVISRTGGSGWTKDANGNRVRVYAQDETSYGEPAGLFGINCGHHPMLFIPGATQIMKPEQNEEQNEKQYAESQQQRELERNLREARRDYEVLKAQNASAEEMRAAKSRIRSAENELDQFCDATGRARRREREYAPVRATWPDVNLGTVERFGGGYIQTTRR